MLKKTCQCSSQDQGQGLDLEGPGLGLDLEGPGLAQGLDLRGQGLVQGLDLRGQAKAKAKAWTFEVKALSKAWTFEVKALAKATKFGLENYITDVRMCVHSAHEKLFQQSPKHFQKLNILPLDCTILCGPQTRTPCTVCP